MGTEMRLVKRNTVSRVFYGPPLFILRGLKRAVLVYPAFFNCPLRARPARTRPPWALNSRAKAIPDR